ncbi:molybdenum cofactor biosynthesis protein MoaE [Gluconacetobacter entanii]|uniref:Molybdopterin synthase catalytic subunit n=1 Tax=Gluconacetobacter entanii TaxID=108528 RepID=A0ABT3K993_9PROT|nr:molybdenum cofactor biosynthesis protein MoaE [Gluconacetobacter entanii]MCW4591577.1 molybdenum cofactor biosynthesis protein MoaE [Gluconacetobacter entanii]MCW4595379.1 molybdenum cofactor biosynthesis protein MoaE [Gluconacetobacter entanii]NPC89808.1 molybdenum cofactor biosynthesis protein MoaE [Gluconacetobacter entanii]
MPCIHVRVQTEPFDPTHESSILLAGHSDVGAVASFVGMVRGDGGLCSLELEHYPGMTESMMTRIAESAASRFGLSGCTIIHRVGRLTVGAPIVLVICTAAHRGAAFAAVEFVMDWLKSRAPFWKKEEFRDGRIQWVQPREQDAQCLQRWEGDEAYTPGLPKASPPVSPPKAE